MNFPFLHMIIVDHSKEFLQNRNTFLSDFSATVFFGFICWAPKLQSSKMDRRRCQKFSITRARKSGWPDLEALEGKITEEQVELQFFETENLST